MVNTANGAGSHGLGAEPQSRTGGSQSHGIDHNHPLFLHSSDVSGVQIIFFQLIGAENYSLWYRYVKVALLERNILGLVDGTCTNISFQD